MAVWRHLWNPVRRWVAYGQQQAQPLTVTRRPRDLLRCPTTPTSPYRVTGTAAAIAGCRRQGHYQLKRTLPPAVGAASNTDSGGSSRPSWCYASVARAQARGSQAAGSTS